MKALKALSIYGAHVSRYLCVGCSRSLHISRNLSTSTKLSLEQIRLKLRDRNASAKSILREFNLDYTGNRFYTGIVKVVVLSSGGPGTPTSFLLIIENAKDGKKTYKNKYFMFNCGEESFSRTDFNKTGAGVSDIKNIFITHHSWKNVGGIHSVMKMATEFNYLKELICNGPPDVMKEDFDEVDNIAIRKSVPEYTSFQEDFIKIDYVPIFRNSRGHKVSEKEMYRKCSVAYIVKPLKEKLTRLPAQWEKLIALEKTMSRSTNELDQIGGKKTARGKVKRKKSVTPIAEVYERERSKMIDNPIMPTVCTERTFSNVLVLECPDTTYLDSLLDSDKLKDECAELKVVIHMSPQHVIEDSKYKEFMRRFDESTYHILMNEATTSCVFLLRYQQHQFLMDYIDTEIFPPLLGSDDLTKLTPSKEGVFHKAVPNAVTVLFPKFKEMHCKSAPAHQYLSVTNKKHAAVFSEKLKKSLKAMRESEESKDLVYPELVFLGTGASAPSLYRGHAGIYLSIDEHSAILLDCGEGTLSRMQLLYGEKADEMLTKIKFIFVSHLHFDHYAGLFGILEARYKAYQKMNIPFEKVVVFAPNSIMRRWSLYRNLWPDFINSLDLVTQNDTVQTRSIGIKNDICESLNLKQLVPVRVLHTAQSFGLVIQHNEGWKIVYSGDARPPCHAFNTCAMNCDVLIHEGTFLNSQLNRAKQTFHSTVGEAVEVGKKINAKYTILTHFSNSQTAVPYMDDTIMSEPNVGVAFDFMKIKMRDLPYLHQMKPVIQTVFADKIDLIESKIEKMNTKHKLDTLYGPNSKKKWVQQFE